MRMVLTLFVFIMIFPLYSAEDSRMTLIGIYQYHVSQRMVDDNGLSALLSDQTLGGKSLVFVSQKKYLEKYGSMEAPHGYELSKKSSVRPSFPFPVNTQKAMNSRYRGILTAVTGKMVTEKIKSYQYITEEDGRKPSKIREVITEVTYFLADDQPILLPDPSVIKSDGKIEVKIDLSSLKPEDTVIPLKVRLKISDQEITVSGKQTLAIGRKNQMVFEHSGKKEDWFGLELTSEMINSIGIDISIRE